MQHQYQVIIPATVHNVLVSGLPFVKAVEYNIGKWLDKITSSYTIIRIETLHRNFAYFVKMLPVTKDATAQW